MKNGDTVNYLLVYFGISYAAIATSAIAVSVLTRPDCDSYHLPVEGIAANLSYGTPQGKATITLDSGESFVVKVPDYSIGDIVKGIIDGCGIFSSDKGR